MRGANEKSESENGIEKINLFLGLVTNRLGLPSGAEVEATKNRFSAVNSKVEKLSECPAAWKGGRNPVGMHTPKTHLY